MENLIKRMAGLEVYQAELDRLWREAKKNGVGYLGDALAHNLKEYRKQSKLLVGEIHRVFGSERPEEVASAWAAFVVAVGGCAWINGYEPAQKRLEEERLIQVEDVIRLRQLRHHGQKMCAALQNYYAEGEGGELDETQPGELQQEDPRCRGTNPSG